MSESQAVLRVRGVRKTFEAENAPVGHSAASTDGARRRVRRPDGAIRLR
jgi:hypothetical protein